jgi:hypothetical protein
MFLRHVNNAPPTSWQVVPLHEIKKKLKGPAPPLLVRVSHKTNFDVVALKIVQENSRTEGEKNKKTCLLSSNKLAY